MAETITRNAALETAKRARQAGVTKPSPTSVTGLPKTNANSVISGSMQTPQSAYAGTANVLGQPSKTNAEALAGAEAAGAERATPYTGPKVNGQSPTPVVAATTQPAQQPTAGAPVVGEDGLMRDAGSSVLEDAGEAYIKGKNDISKIWDQNKAEDLASIQREYEARQASLAEMERIAKETNAQQTALAESASAVQREEARLAQEKSTREIELQRERTAEAYKDMQIAQELANKRAELKKETAMGVLGGAFTSAGVADIESVIMEGESTLRNLAKEADFADQGFTNQVTDVINTYKLDNMKIEQYKAESLNTAYKELQNVILQITENKALAVSEKEQAIREAGNSYNERIANLNGEVVQARYELAQGLVARSDQLREEARVAEETKKADDAKLRDDARMALQNLMTTMPAEAFTSLNEEQKAQLRELEAAAGYPEGFLEQGFQSLKELNQEQKNALAAQKVEISNRLADLKQKGMVVTNFQSDENGNVTMTVYDKVTGNYTQESLGNIGKGTAQYGTVVLPDGTVLSTNRYDGSASVLDPNSGGSGIEGTPGTPPPEGTKNVSSMSTGKTAPPLINGFSFPQADFDTIFGVGKIGGWCGNYASTISTAPKVGNSWAEKINKVDKRENPKAGDKLVLPIGVGDGSNPYGHIVSVLSYDPTTDIITGTQSNADGAKKTNGDGRGTVTGFSAKLSDLQAQYGNDFGFISGELKPNIKKQLDQLKAKAVLEQNNPGQSLSDLSTTDLANRLRTLNPSIKTAGMSRDVLIQRIEELEEKEDLANMNTQSIIDKRTSTGSFDEFLKNF